MKTNLWLYADSNEQLSTAAHLIAFGAEIFKRAKTIKEIVTLKKIKQDLDNNLIHPNDNKIHEFIHEYLVDCIRFTTFFENYTKAILIIKGYCVHVIDPNHTNFKSLSNVQKKRPIALNEIDEIEKFIIDNENKTIFHNAINDQTIQINVLINSEPYCSIYGIEPRMIDIIKKFNYYRNRLHFNFELGYILTDTFLSELEFMNQFVDKTIKEWFINSHK